MLKIGIMNKNNISKLADILEKDEDGEYLEINNVNGGLCTGSARDAVWFMV